MIDFLVKVNKTEIAKSFLFILLCFFSFVSLSMGSLQLNEKKMDNKTIKLSACQACITLVNSFKDGMERTSRGKFEGGDTAWEEKNQIAGYLNSEVRFIEIQEDLCKDITKGELQCHDNHHNWEEFLEEWWRLKEPRPSLKDWLCNNKLEVCCPENTFGPNCLPCLFKDKFGKFCSDHGKCDGRGTRKGNGKCLCHKGYSGKTCDKCSVGFYKTNMKSKAFECYSCSKSCNDICRCPNPIHCDKCKAGCKMDKIKGCMYINECSAIEPCEKNQFCKNTDGFFKCYNCHKSCKGCRELSSNCIDCNKGYIKRKYNKSSFSCGLLKKENLPEYLSEKNEILFLGEIIILFVSFHRSKKVPIFLSFVSISSKIIIDILSYLLSFWTLL